jgi:hypothetical protein
MSYLCVKWNSFGLRSLADAPGLKHGLCLAGHSRSEDLRRKSRRAKAAVEGVASAGY